MFAHCAVLNAVLLWKQNVRGEHSPSFGSAVSGIMGCAGLWVLPVPGVARFAWTALLLDCGCLPMMLAAIADIEREAYVDRRKALVMRLSGRHANGTKSVLSIYENGEYILEQTDMPSTFALSLIGDWHREAGALLLAAGKETIVYEPDKTGMQYDWRPASDEGTLEGVALQIMTGESSC